MTITDVFARRATLSRSLGLLKAVRYEQSDPDYFYTILANDTVDLVTDLWQGLYRSYPLGCSLVDVGSGPGYFASAFTQAGLYYIGVDAQRDEMNAAGLIGVGHPGSFVQASGLALPFATNSVDIAISSNVAEHVRAPWQLGQELLRIVRPGGLALLSYTVWLGPFGGHETGLAHYLGGYRAANRYRRRNGHWPKNNYGISLFAVSVADGLRWARSTGAFLKAFPRYHPRWAWWVTDIPVLSEFMVSNVVLVLQKPLMGNNKP